MQERSVIAADRSANDIAKQVTMTSERDEVIRTRKEKQCVKVTKIFKSDDRKRRDPRNVGRTKRTTPWQEAAMKAFIMKEETVQGVTQWHWRTPTSNRYREPL